MSKLDLVPPVFHTPAQLTQLSYGIKVFERIKRDLKNFPEPVRIEVENLLRADLYETLQVYTFLIGYEVEIMQDSKKGSYEIADCIIKDFVKVVDGGYGFGTSIVFNVSYTLKFKGRISDYVTKEFPHQKLLIKKQYLDEIIQQPSF